MEHDRTGPDVKVLNWARSILKTLGRNLQRFSERAYLQVKGTSGKLENIKSEIARV